MSILTPPAPVTVPPIVAVVKLPLLDKVTVVKVPSRVTVSKSPSASNVNAGPAVSSVSLGFKAPVAVNVTRSSPVTATSTKLSDEKLATSCPIVTFPS